MTGGGTLYEYSTSWPDDGIGSEWQIAVRLLVY